MVQDVLRSSDQTATAALLPGLAGAMALLLGAEVDRPRPADEESEERMLRMMLEANQR